MLADIFRSIYANGFKRIISVNGHGGNAAPCRAVSWQVAEENIFTLSFNWWDMVEKELREWSATNEGVGHAGEWETAVQLHLREHLVDKSRIDSDETGTRPFGDDLKFAEFAERRRDTKKIRALWAMRLLRVRKRVRAFLNWLVNAWKSWCENITSCRCASTASLGLIVFEC